MNSQITIFCGSSIGIDPIYHTSIKEVGRKLVANKYGLIYAGGSTGLMGILADEMLSLKG